MKKFLMMVLAVAFVAAAVPALAGDFTASGSYFLQGIAAEVKESGGFKTNDAWYINQFFLNTTLTQGIVSAYVSFELSDANYKELSGHTILRNGNKDLAGMYQNDIVDQYWLTAKLMDNLTLKTGNYYLHWGNMIAIYKQGGYNLGVSYTGLDMVDLGLTIGKVGDGWTTGDVFNNGNKDADYDQYLLSAMFKKAGPFTKLNFYLVDQTVAAGTYYVPEPWISTNNDYNLVVKAKTSDTLFGAEFAIPAGPVALSGELGTMSGDTLKGNYFLITGGFKDLVGFDLNASIFRSSDPGTTKTFGLAEGWSPLIILLNNDTQIRNEVYLTTLANYPQGTRINNGNMTLLLLSGSYAVNDKFNVGATIMPYAKETKKYDGNGKIGTEIDVTGTYKFADNFNWMIGGGYLAGANGTGNLFDGAKVTAYTTKLNFTF